MKSLSFRMGIKIRDGPDAPLCHSRGSLDGDRLLITLTEWPETLDTEKKFYPAQDRELALLLEPFFLEERTGWFSFDKEPLRRRMRGLCR